MKNADVIRAAIECGFPTHEGDPSMLDFANRIAYDARQNLKAELQADGWRQCAKGQHTSQFCGQLEAAVLAEREACAMTVRELDLHGEEIAAASAIRARSEKCAT